MTTVEVTCKDKSYEWLLAWITKRGARKTQHLSVDTTFVESENGKISTRYDFQPSVGTHLMRYNVNHNSMHYYFGGFKMMFFQGVWIRIERTRENRMMEPWETVQMTTLGNHKTLFVDILEEAREMVMSKQHGKTIMYTVIGTEWRPFGHPR